MNTLSSMLKFLGNTLGANPSTLGTTSKTLVGAINEVAARPALGGTGTVVRAITATKTDVQVAGGDSAVVYIDTPATPEGYTLIGLIDAWTDGSGTTNPNYVSYILISNHWGDTTATTGFTLRNLGTGQGRVSLNAKWLYARSAS